MAAQEALTKVYEAAGGQYVGRAIGGANSWIRNTLGTYNNSDDKPTNGLCFALGGTWEVLDECKRPPRGIWKIYLYF